MLFAVQVCRLLSEWITFLLLVVPPRSRRTFVELLCGCLMSQDGWLTRVIVRISANVTVDFGNVTDRGRVLGCAR
jgi:hypothetical protein